MSPTRSARSARPALAVSAAALTLLLAGCSQPGGDPGEEPAIGAVPALLQSRDLAFPMDAYLPDDRQQGVLAEAQDVLVDQCMQRYGFRYRLRREDDSAAAHDYSRRYGLSDPAEAARLGYEQPRTARAQRPPQPELGPNEQLVLYGLDVDPSLQVPTSQEEAEKSDVATTVVGGQKVPAGGCLRESNLKLFTPTKDTVGSLDSEGLRMEAYARSRKDGRVVKAFKSWSECMGGHGFTVDNPMDRPPGIDDSNIGSPQAIAQAARDVDCKRETNLVGIWYTVELAYQNRVIEKNAEKLDLVKRQLDERMKFAATLIATGR
ncbi:hypothetical protein [Streptomyces sp. NPDC096339]|uniref:hypothetical protein n=1 Tax=Streptomyces sp. NPDC096339 TaxID=3366086 RepID=UPI003813A8A8